MLHSPLSLCFTAALLLSAGIGGPATANAEDSNNEAFDLNEIRVDSGPMLKGEDEPYRTGWVWVDPVEDLAADAIADSHISNIIFLNRCVGGCTINPGSNDARTNQSSIAQGTSLLSEYAGTQAQWDETIACVRDLYSPYDVNVVEEDPGAETIHHEAIVAGMPGELGLAPNIGGIAPSGCSPLNNVISFSFANSNFSQNQDPLTMCWTIAQESAHAFGLPNHVFHCMDPMTYLDGNCGKKYFRNKSLPCGEFEQSNCNCSGVTQNSHVELSAVFGPGELPAPPEIEIQYPKPDTVLADEFSIYWVADDERLIDHTEIWINGTKYADIPGKEWTGTFQPNDYHMEAPTLPDGVIELEVRAVNEIGSEASQTITLTKGAPCSNADSCFDFQECNEGRCEYGAAAAELGDGCAVDPQCLEGTCAEVGGERACAMSCIPTVSGACFEGFECETTSSGDSVCWAVAGDTGGCCSVAGSKGDPLPWFGLGMFLFGLVVIRRRRA
ncbi:MAG: hypothetical protein GY811_28620 [Myxococcales bacterium]|nr:hypothetical protein [Myxococcales bacterium]